jgi:hypothetical protein
MSRPSDILAPYDRVLVIKTKAGLVPLYKFIEKFLYIENAHGMRIQFILNDDQVDLYKSMCEQKQRGEPIRINILKARQAGFSTFIAAIIFCSVIFTPGQRAAIVADIAEHASNLFGKYNFFYDNLPVDIKERLVKVKSNAKELVVSHGEQTSSIRITVQGDSAGRSGTYQYLHLSECAFWDDLDSTLVSLLQTVSNDNKNSMVFFETTANGVNDYKKRWDNDYSGNTKYMPKFYPWYTNKRYVVADKDIREFRKPNWLAEIEVEYNLTPNQVAWFFDKYNEFNGDLDKLRQEFPSNPVEAFVTSGNSVFNAELLRKRKEEIIRSVTFKRGIFQFEAQHSMDGKRIDVTKREWIDSRNGSIKIFKEPEAGHPYVVVNDPAQGGEDYYATQVFNNYTGEQVAVYHRNKCDADDAAYQMYCLAMYYNKAMITGETNTTSYLLELCHKMGYRFIYQDQDVEDLTNRYLNKFGFKTKQNNRQYMIDLFKIAFRENPRIINDYETICEMEAFQVVKNSKGKEKAEATGGEHDDLVMSACGFYLCRGAQTSVPRKDTISKRSTIDELEMMLEKRRKANYQQERNVYQIWD